MEGKNLTQIVTELQDPVLSGDNLSYTVKVLQGEMPAKANDVAMFIDIFGRPLTPISFAGFARRATTAQPVRAIRLPPLRNPPHAGALRVGNLCSKNCDWAGIGPQETDIQASSRDAPVGPHQRQKVRDNGKSLLQRHALSSA